MKRELRELAFLFLKLGTIAFGGPAAHIAMMEEEVVRRRGWMPRDRFLDLLATTNLIPGPNSTEMAIHIGYLRAGFPGLLVAGACFILPAALIVAGVGWMYTAYGRLPSAEALFYGVKPVVIAIVADALWRLAGTAFGTPARMAIAVAAGAAVLLTGLDEIAVLAIAGALGLTLGRIRPSLLRRPEEPAGGEPHPAAGGGTRGEDGEAAPCLALPVSHAAAGTAAAAGAAGAAAFSLPTLFLVFVKIGSVLFGSGYVLLAFLRADFVERLGWLTEDQLLDAIAVGQITPGPVFTTATFVGWILGGAPGAAVATLGIFLPAFVFVALSGPLVPRIRRSPTAASFLDGVVVASLGLMGAVTLTLARAALVDATTVVIAAGALLLLVFRRVNAAWLILGGAAIGILLAPMLGR